MDAKMDSGDLVPGETLDDDYDVLRELLPEEVVGIMDQLLSHEVRSACRCWFPFLSISLPGDGF